MNAFGNVVARRGSSSDPYRFAGRSGYLMAEMLS